MTTIEPGVLARSSAGPAFERWTLAIFAATLFLSALLLFMVQPMFTKMVLPLLGGSPAVWSVAMVFFQGALLAGYGYAHILVRTLPPGRAALVHLVVLTGAAWMLPIGVRAGFGVPPTSGIEIWTLGLFLVSIGLPFMALSASAPLLQSWFAVTHHVKARNPYVLYAASNIGSFAALLSYPFAVEPLLRLRDQSGLWSGGFAATAILIAVAGLIVSRQAPERVATAVDRGAAPTWFERSQWIALGAIPCGLCIAVTAHITMDIAAAPFLWVLPLALYLLTFVAVFRDRPWVSHDANLRYLPIVLAPLCINIFASDPVFWLVSIALNLVAFTMIALACHGELYRRRPVPERLTEFYLWISVGGLAGGTFAGLLAAHLFNGTYEYPLLIVAALLMLPDARGQQAGLIAILRQAWPGLAVAAVLALLKFVTAIDLPPSAQAVFRIGLIGLVGVMMWQRGNRARFLGLVVIAFVIAGLWQPGMKRVEMVRSFFGIHQVVDSTDGAYRMLFHGTTLHGAEQIRDTPDHPISVRPEPLAYYYFGGPISEAIGSARAAHGLADVAVVGLGVGSLACHRQGNERWTFFEIDPAVERIARDPHLFRFLSACAPDAPVVIGDARLTLARRSDLFDVIVLDAFSSDAIPVHLLTKEAFEIYRTRLAPHGIIVAHISNRHMELASVVGAVAKTQGMVAIVKRDTKANNFQVDYHANAIVAVVARETADFGDLPAAGWQPITSDVQAWTDDYSNLVGAIVRKKFGG